MKESAFRPVELGPANRYRGEATSRYTRKEVLTEKGFSWVNAKVYAIAYPLHSNNRRQITASGCLGKSSIRPVLT